MGIPLLWSTGADAVDVGLLSSEKLVFVGGVEADVTEEELDIAGCKVSTVSSLMIVETDLDRDSRIGGEAVDSDGVLRGRSNVEAAHSEGRQDGVSLLPVGGSSVGGEDCEMI